MSLSPYRTPAEPLATRSIPHSKLGRLCNAFGLSEFRSVRKWLGGRWELWHTPHLEPACMPIWFRVVEWTDATNLDEARDRNHMHSSIWISREDWSIVEREEHRSRR